VHDRAGDCIRQFNPHVLEDERECVEHLDYALEQIECHRERANVDVLALCVDKTAGADYVQTYWNKNIELAQAGVYISRVFVYDPSTRDQVLSVAREQSQAGVRSFVIARQEIEPFLRETYGCGLFGFTAIQGVEALDQVVLHSGLGEQVIAAAYRRSLLTEYFAGIHGAIRRKAVPARQLRPDRAVDVERTRVNVEVAGHRLDAVRLDYEATQKGCSAMSIALGRWHNRRNLARDEVVYVSANKLEIEQKPMRVSHFHSVDRSVCSRRQHKNCKDARDGDYVVGLQEIA
jgi:hypothetical protein